MYDCPKSRFRMMSNHIDARSWAVPTLQNDLNAVTVSITDCYPDRLLARFLIFFVGFKTSWQFQSNSCSKYAQNPYSLPIEYLTVSHHTLSSLMKPQYLLGNILAFLAILPAASLAQSSNQTSKKTNPVESTAKDIAVQLSADRGSGNAFTGSGVLIGKEGNIYTVLSAAHIICSTESSTQSCLEPANIELTTSDGETYIANEVKEFPFQLDLVLVKFRSPFKYSIAKMGDSTQIKRGDQLFSSGFTKGDEWNFYEGKLIANTFKKLTPGGHDLSHNAKTIPGMSGGGIYNTKGELICINSQLESLVSASSCVPIAFYREFDPQVEKVASELYLIGKNEYYKNNYKEAVDYLSQAIAKDPTFAEAYFLRGECYYQQDKYKAALKSYEKASTLNPNMADAYIGQGKSAYSLNDHTSALKSFKKASELQPQDALSLQWQGIVLYNQDNYEQAIKIIEQAIKLDDESEYSHNLIGKSYESNGQIEQALASYNRAIGIGGSNSKSLPLRAKLHLKNQSYDQAIQDYNLLVEREYNPNKIEHHWSRSTAAIAVQNYDQALIDMDAIIKINENYRPAYLRKAQSHDIKGEYSQAIASYSDFIDRFTPKVAPYNSGISSSTAIPTATLSTSYYDYSYDDSKATAHRGRGLVYLQQKQYQNAASDLQIAAELYRQDNKLEEEQFCLNTLQNLPKTTKPRTVKPRIVKNELRRK
jgi:tetratricopeptide (TPR) repeat protein